MRRTLSAATLIIAVCATGCATSFTTGSLPAPAAWQSDLPSPVAAPAPMPAHPQSHGVVPVAWYPDADPGPVGTATTAVFTPAEPRVPTAAVNGRSYPTMPGSTNAMVYQYPDEYLFDGGDRGMKVHYKAGERRGIETEDTIAEYADHLGQHHVRASNPVAIYAPRFAAVRTMTEPEQDVSVDRLAMASDGIPGAGLHGHTAMVTSNRRSKASGMRTRERGSEVETLDATIAMQSQTRPVGNVFVLKALKRRQLLAGARFEHANEAWLAKRVQKAAEWSWKEYPIIQAVTASANEVRSSFRPQEHIGLDVEHSKGDLRIVKMADLTTAVPGDIVTFTIEFENIGGKALHDVRIIDNLTPRLEYVADSGASDMQGKIIVDDNGLGSSMLTFEIPGELAAGAKGTVEFQARVR